MSGGEAVMNVQCYDAAGDLTLRTTTEDYPGVAGVWRMLNSTTHDIDSIEIHWPDRTSTVYSLPKEHP